MKTDLKSGVAELSLAMVIAGTIGVFVVESGQPAFNVVFFRCLFGALALLGYCWARGFLRGTGVTRRNLPLVLAGGVCIVFNWVFLFKSYTLTSITLATVVYHTQPFYVVLLGAIVFRDLITRSKVAWIVLAFVGILFVTQIDPTSFSADVGYLIGIGYALLAALLYACATIAAKRLKGARPHIIALIQVSLGVLLLLPFTTLGDVRGIGANWAHLLTLGVVHTGFTYILMYSSYQKLTTPVIAVLTFIYPAVAIVTDYLFYGTTVTALQVLGIALIVAASLGVNLGWLFPLLGGRRGREPAASPAMPTAARHEPES